MTPILQAKGVSKLFGAFHALASVDFEAFEGEVHAIVGENGAGKTTLARLLIGYMRPTNGIVISDEGTIGMVSQHYSVIPELSCIENLVLGSEGGGLIPWGNHIIRANEISEELGFTFDWDTPASALSASDLQRLEILKLMWRDSRVLILDEPTAMLSPIDSSSLYKSLKALASKGKTVIVITHKISEVMEHCDRVTVLRGGVVVDSKLVSETNSHELAEMIIGKQYATIAKRLTTPGATMLELDCAHKLEIKSGEIVGIAGVDGNGQRQLFESLIGTTSMRSGTLSINGLDATNLSTSERIRQGMRIVPEDRHAQGIIGEWSLRDNAVLGIHRLQKDLSTRDETANRVLSRFDVAYQGIQSKMQELSGGNQQKFVVAKAFEHNPKILLFFQPTRGLDIVTTQRVFDEIRNICATGACALVVSFDLDDLIELCDRIVVMRNGEIFQPTISAEFDRHEIGKLMVGA